MLMKLKSRSARSLSKCRELTTFFQAIFLNRLIEQDHDNIFVFSIAFETNSIHSVAEKASTTSFNHLLNVMNQDVFSDWCRQIIIKVYLVFQKEKSLNIECTYYNFINLVIFDLFSNIDFRFWFESIETARFDLIDWNANEFLWLIIQIQIRNRLWKLRKCKSCDLLTKIKTFYIDINWWWNFRIFYNACDLNMSEFWSCDFRFRREKKRRS